MPAPAGRFFYEVKRLQVEIQAVLEAAFRSLDLTPTQYTALSLIRHHGSLSSADLARRLWTTPQSSGELIAALLKRALVERRADPASRRILRLAVSAEGERTLGRCDALVRELEAAVFGGLSSGAVDQARELLRDTTHRLRLRRLGGR